VTLGFLKQICLILCLGHSVDVTKVFMCERIDGETGGGSPLLLCFDSGFPTANQIVLPAWALHCNEQENADVFLPFLARMCTCMDWAAGSPSGTMTAILPTIIRGVILQKGSLVSHLLVTAHVGHAGVPILLSIEFC